MREEEDADELVQELYSRDVEEKPRDDPCDDPPELRDTSSSPHSSAPMVVPAGKVNSRVHTTISPSSQYTSVTRSIVNLPRSEDDGEEDEEDEVDRDDEVQELNSRDDEQDEELVQELNSFDELDDEVPCDDDEDEEEEYTLEEDADDADCEDDDEASKFHWCSNSDTPTLAGILATRVKNV